MQPLTIAAAQFEHQNADKDANFAQIEVLTRQAKQAGSQVVSFHECCITGYTFLQTLTKRQLLDLAEPVPDGPSCQRLQRLASAEHIAVLAGLLEREGEEVFNTYVCFSSNGFVAKHRKIHAFVNPHLSSGDRFTVFDLDGTRCGILICYDNNIIENVRTTTLLGAEVVFMPHVTGCLPSVMPGRGLVAPELWQRRSEDPVPLRQAFQGPKHRGWLMRWLPARAYDNGIYAVFTNPIGMDDDQVRGGSSLILDPYGEILAECQSFGAELAIAQCVPEKLAKASARRYIQARRTELFSPLLEASDQPAETAPGWRLKRPTDLE